MTYQPKAEEKLVPIMIYTPQKLIWGRLVTMQAIRVSNILQNEMAPDYFTLIDAQVLLFGAGQATQSLKFQMIQVATAQILAYHLLPPADESPYFDVNEPNRRMAHISALLGVFQFECSVRVAAQSELRTFLGAQKGDFLPVYDITMHCPLLPKLKPIKTPFMLLRQAQTAFGEN